MREDQFLATASERMTTKAEDEEVSVGEYVLLLISRIEKMEKTEGRSLHSWKFTVVRNAQGFIESVIADPILH